MYGVILYRCTSCNLFTSAKNIHRCKYYNWGILLIFYHADGMYCICTSLINIKKNMMSHWPWSFEWTTSFYELIKHSFICIYMCNIFLVMHKLCTNEYLSSNYLYVKGKHFYVSLLFSEEKIWYQQNHLYGLSYHG